MREKDSRKKVGERDKVRKRGKRDRRETKEGSAESSKGILKTFKEISEIIYITKTYCNQEFYV